MAAFGTIYSYPGNFRVQRAQALAALNGLSVTLDPGFQMGVTNRSEAFLTKFPLGKVPALECADGFCLSESAAISAYLAGSGPKAAQLLGADVKTRALINQWAIFADLELAQPGGVIAAMYVIKYMKPDEARYAAEVAAFQRAIARLEKALAADGGRKFLVGDSLTMADVMMYGSIFAGSGFLFDAEMRKTAPHVERYAKELSKIKELKEAFGELKMVETRVKP